MADEASKEPNLEQRRYAAELHTIDELIALGYRARAKCFRCEKAREIDLRRLAAKYGRRTLRSLGDAPRCEDCERRGRKMSIHPAGKDTMISVLFPGETA